MSKGKGKGTTKKKSINTLKGKGYTTSGKTRQNVFNKKPPRKKGKLRNVLDQNPTALASIFYNGKSCYLRNTGLIGGLDIKYTGTLHAISDLPDEFMFMEGNYQIIVINWGRDNHSYDLKLFDYTGSFKIISAKVVTPALDNIRCTVTFNYEKSNLDSDNLGDGNLDLRWDKNYNTYGSITAEWHQLYSPMPDLGGGMKKTKNIIIHPKQAISKDKLFTNTGEPYEGKIVTYSNGTIYSNDQTRKKVQLFKTRELNKTRTRRFY